MNIGELSRVSKVPTRTIRYYEEIGLIPEAVRGSNGYRHYEQKDVDRLDFLRRTRAFGFTIEECRKLLDLLNDPKRKSADVKAVTEAHLKELDAQLKELRALRKQLGDLAGACAGDGGADCVILNALQSGH